MSELTIAKRDGTERRVQVWPHNGGRFVTWCDVTRDIDMHPSSWRQLGYEVVEAD